MANWRGKLQEPEFISSLPEIEWWSKTFNDKDSDHVLEKMVENGEIEIKVEVNFTHTITN